VTTLPRATDCSKGHAVEVIQREYDYRPRWWPILCAVLFFGSGAIFFRAQAVTNDRGLILNGIVTLSEQGATWFYWALATLSSGFVLAGILMVVHRLVYRQRVVFKATLMTAPKSRWSSSEIDIPYHDILQVSRKSFKGQHRLEIIHTGGRYIISAIMLASRDTFDEVSLVLADRVNAARARQARQT
jgi:hypothetical protein